MKKLLSKVFLFLLIGYSILFIIDYYITIKIINKATGYDAELPEIYQGNINCDLLIIGTSRAKMHFLCEEIEKTTNIKAYNIGIGAARFDVAYLLFKEYIKRQNQKPKIITLSLDNATLVYNDELHKPYRLYPFLLFDKDMYKTTHKFKGFYDYYYFIPLTRYVLYWEEIKNNFLSNFKIIYKGSNKFDSSAIYSSIDMVSFRKDSLKFINNPKHIKPTPKLLEQLQEFINYCKQENIKINMVYSPEYIYGQQFISNIDSIKTFYKFFAKKNKIEFIDFSTQEINYDSSLFTNVMHLNIYGAKKFTEEYYIPFLEKQLSLP